MAGVTKKGSDSYLVDRTKILLVYNKNTNEVLFCGTHIGEISGKKIIVEGYSNVNKVLLRIQELGLILPDSISEEMAVYKKKVKSFLDIDEVIAGGKDVIFSLNKDKDGLATEDSILEDYEPAREEFITKMNAINEKKMKREMKKAIEDQKDKFEKDQIKIINDLMKKSMEDNGILT